MSWASTEGVRRSMRSNRSSGTRPEIRLRQALHRAGLRFRVQYPVPSARRRRIDVAFPRLKVAVYIDGCFWHGCPQHPFTPKRNAEYWSGKFVANRARDAETEARLELHGWVVLRVWEHEAAEAAVERVLAVVRARRAATPPTRAGTAA